MLHTNDNYIIFTIDLDHCIYYSKKEGN